MAGKAADRPSARVARAGHRRPSRLRRAHAGVLGLSDRPEPGLGPLGGLAAALHHAERIGFTRVLCIGCDTPSIAPQLLDELLRATEPVYLAGLPIVSAWPAHFSGALDRWLATDTKRSVRGWAAHANARAVEGTVPLNVNRPEDLRRLCSDAI